MAKRYSAIVHSLTPFDEKMRVDEAALRKHLRRLIVAGVGVYIGAAGAADGYTLTREERETIVAKTRQTSVYASVSVGGPAAEFAAWARRGAQWLPVGGDLHYMLAQARLGASQVRALLREPAA